METNRHNNILDILQKMGQVSDTLHDTHDPRAIGFDCAYYVLKYALKKLDGINFILENKRLSKDNTELTAKCENQKMEIKNLSENIFKLKFAGKDEILF